MLKLPLIGTEDILRRINSTEIISTGCRALDDMLGGGVETSAITEFVGEFGTGKTQICHQLSVMVQLPREQGGLEARAVYIDTEGTFRPERIIQIANYRGIEPRKALKNIIYAKAYNIYELISLLSQLENLAEETPIGVVIVDSITTPLRKMFYEMNNTLSYIGNLINTMIYLRNIAYKMNLAVIITNSLIYIPEKNAIKVFGDPYITIFTNNRVILENVRENIRRAYLEYGDLHLYGNAIFRINQGGVVDIL